MAHAFLSLLAIMLPLSLCLEILEGPLLKYFDALPDLSNKVLSSRRYISTPTVVLAPAGTAMYFLYTEYIFLGYHFSVLMAGRQTWAQELIESATGIIATPMGDPVVYESLGNDNNRKIVN